MKKRSFQVKFILLLYVLTFALLSYHTYEAHYVEAHKAPPVFGFAEPLSFLDFTSNYVYFDDLYTGLVAPDEDHIYVIENAVDLYRFSQLANGIERDIYLSLNYVLGNHINYTDASTLGLFFRPVGFLPNPSPDPLLSSVENEALNPLAFQGTFDGQGFEIRNLLLEPIDDLSVYASIYNNALIHYAPFSVVGSSGNVKNLGIINPIFVQPINHGLMQTSSALVGANHGQISHVYLQDLRSAQSAGLNVNGQFHLSGLISINYGSFSNAYVAARLVKSASVNTNLSTHVVLRENLGTISNIVFDTTLYIGSIPSPHLGDGLVTADFQNQSYFSNQWFFNESYQETIRPNYVYPILLGFNRSGTTLLLSRPNDLIYMSHMIDQPFGFSGVNYQIANDIDMSSISRTAYITPVTPYTGIFESRLISTNPFDGILYDRSPDDNAYFTILNLHIRRGVDLGMFAGFGLFGVLQNRVRNLNLAFANLAIQNLQGFVDEDFTSAGMIAARLDTGIITNVNVHIDVSMPSQRSMLTYVGGLIGHGHGTIEFSSTVGHLDMGVRPYHNDVKESAFGGFAGFAGTPQITSEFLYIRDSINQIDLVGPGFTNENEAVTHLGGFVGSGYMRSFFNVINEGSIRSNGENSFLYEVYMGGMIGYQIYLASGNNSNSINIENRGNLTLYVNQPMRARLASGYGVHTNTVNTSGRTLRNIQNYGEIILAVDQNTIFDEDDLALMDIMFAGIWIGFNSNDRVRESANHADYLVDVSFVRSFAGVSIVHNTFDSTSNETNSRYLYINEGDSTSFTFTLAYIENFGHIDAYASHTIMHPLIMITGIHIGKPVHQDYIRNTGDISVNLDQDAPTPLDSAPSFNLLAFPEKRFIVAGVSEEAAAYRRSRYIYNGGRIHFETNPLNDIHYHVYVSGIFYAAQNPREGNDMTRTDLVLEILNDNHVTIDAHVTGSTFAAGIANINTGTIISAVNAADVVNKSAPPNNLNGMDFFVDAAGIANQLANRSSNLNRILNSLNYGNIVAHSTSIFGLVAAAGIIGRNIRTLEHQDITANWLDRYFRAIVRHNINYGSIISWNERLDDYDSTVEAYSISGGIMADGLLQFENNINYGDIYSKTLAGGLIGHLNFDVFAREHNTSSMNVSNIINYGQVRPITSANAYSFQDGLGVTINSSHIGANLNPNGNYAFGGILGHVFVGDQDWNFTANNNNMPSSRFRYWVNFDEQANLVGNLPSTSIVNNSFADALSETMATTKLNDTTPYPLHKVKSYSLDSEPTTGDSGLNGSVFSGIFDESFAFFKPEPTTPPINNAFRFIPTQRVNAVLLEKIGFDHFDVEDETMGIYALGPHLGIGEEGLYLPDHINFDNLNPLNETGAWRLEVVSKNRNLQYKIDYGMKQLSLSLATNIENVQLVDDLTSPNHFFNVPIIDLDEATLTFFISQSSITAYDINESRQIVDAFFVSGPDYVAYGAYEVGGVWYGTHLFDDGEYVNNAEGTHVVIPITLFDSPNPNTFEINVLNHSSYLLGYRASFFYDREDETTYVVEPASLPRSYGPYDENGEIRDINNQVIDRLDWHYGNVRVHAEAYVHNIDDQMTYKDYEVRLIRVQPMEFSAMTSLSVNGIDITPDFTDPLNDYTNVDISNDEVHFKVDGVLGRIIFQYQTKNVLPTNLLSTNERPQTWVQLFNSDDNLVIGNYTVGINNAQDANGYDLVTGKWSDGNLTYTINMTANLPSGAYTLSIKLGYGLDENVYLIQFNKALSGDAFITRIRSSRGSSPTNYDIRNPDFEIETDILYGLYYTPSDATTGHIDFRNLSDLENIPWNQVNTFNGRPRHLNTFTISPFATMVSVDVELNPIKIDGYRHQYIVTYVIRSETGIDYTYVHKITELPVSPNLRAAFKGVNEITPLTLEVEFPREETPTYRMEFDVNNIYRPNEDGIDFGLNYDGLGSPVEGFEYGLVLLSNGYLLSFESSAPIGIYTVFLAFESDFTYSISNYPFENVTFEWAIQFDTIEFRKVGNSNSKLIDIAFTTDSVFAGLNTIIHPTTIAEPLYIELLEDPEKREIILIPVLGIQYNEHIDKQNFYVVGQVANTDLTFYRPDFALPEGANVFRMIDEDTQTSILDFDFSPNEDDETFNFIWYRIYAEDFIPGHPEFGSNFTDYQIAVQDITNNVYLTFEIIMSATTALSMVHVGLTLSLEDLMQLALSFYAHFDGVDPMAENNTIRNTASGLYTVSLNLPAGYQFQITFSGISLSNLSFFVPDSVIPRRYIVQIEIIDALVSPEWGQRVVVPFIPSA